MATWTSIQFCKGQYTTFWNFFFNTLLLYVRQIQTIYLPKTAPTHEQWPVSDKNLSWRHAKNVIFMAFQWAKAQFFLSRLWITIHFLKGLCMNSMIKLVKHKWRSLQTRNTAGVTWFLKSRALPISCDSQLLSLFHDLASVPTETDMIVRTLARRLIRCRTGDFYTSLSGLGSGVGLLTGSSASWQIEPKG